MQLQLTFKYLPLSRLAIYAIQSFPGNFASPTTFSLFKAPSKSPSMLPRGSAAELTLSCTLGSRRASLRVASSLCDPVPLYCSMRHRQYQPCTFIGAVPQCFRVLVCHRIEWLFRHGVAAELRRMDLVDISPVPSLVLRLCVPSCASLLSRQPLITSECNGAPHGRSRFLQHFSCLLLSLSVREGKRQR